MAPGALLQLLVILCAGHLGVGQEDQEYDVQLNNSALNVSVIDYSFTCPDGLHYDFCLFMENLSLIKDSWQDDDAFLPTAITYSVTFTVGLIGNLLVVFALIGDRKAHTITSSFLVSLAIADLLFLLICVPYEVGIHLKKSWFGSNSLCKFFGYIEFMSGTASVLNLTAVSVERYVVIVHPMKSRTWCTMGNTKRIIGGIWVLAVILAIPIVVIRNIMHFYYFNDTGSILVSTCFGDSVGSEHDDLRLILGISWYQLTVIFIIPVIIINFCYAFVIHVLWISTKELAKLTHSSSLTGDDGKHHLAPPPNRNTKALIPRAVKSHSVDVREARKQVIRMLLTIIVIYFLCWCPKVINTILKRHEVRLTNSNAYFWIGTTANLLPYFQSCANPIIYSFMSKNFRRSMRSAWRSLCPKCSRCPEACTRRKATEFDMEAKNGNPKYSPTSLTNTRVASRTMYSSVVSEC